MQIKYSRELVIIAVLVIVITSGIYFWSYQSKSKRGNIDILTLAKHQDWQTQTDSVNGFSFKYPATFGANVWRSTVWPPTVTVVAAGQDPVAVGCPNYTKEESNNPAGVPGSIDSLNYTLYKSAGVGAGNLYNEFCYVYGGVDKSYVMNIEIHSHTACGENCGAYCGTQYEQECATLDRNTAIEQPIQDVAESFKLIK